MLKDFFCLIARYLRLELLEGVVAYHTGQFDKALNALKSAHTKFLQVSGCTGITSHLVISIVTELMLLCVVMQLQIPDETLSLVMGMGFQEKDAKRALRLNNQDIASSVDFLIEERAKRAKKREQDFKRQQEILYVLLL